MPRPIEPIFDIEGNRSHFSNLQAQFDSRGGLVPFVGAGASFDYKMPLWRDFLLEHAKNTGIKVEITQLLDQGDYEEAAQVLEDKMQPFGLKPAVEAAYGEGQNHLHNLTDTTRLVNLIGEDLILTTNFDRILERGAEALDINRKVLLNGNFTPEMAENIQKRQPGLIKIHGDALDQNHRVLTKNEYDLAYGDRNDINMNLPVPKLLHALLQNRSLLFVGSSLEQDRTVNTILKVMRGGLGIRHYALLEYIPDATARARKIELLTARNILPIWYPHRQYHFIHLILRELLEQNPRTRNLVVETPRITRQELIDELAELYYDENEARKLWRSINAKQGRFKRHHSPVTMWDMNFAEFEHGMMSPVVLLEKVLEAYPEQRIIQAYLEQLKKTD